MANLIDGAVDRSRAVLLILLLILFTGTAVYLSIPRESSPDVKIPIIYVSMTHEGISPEDAERLLIRPMEKELRAIEGIKEMRSSARQGHASVLLEFSAGFNSDKALLDVREKVDQAKPELPDETEEPVVNEVNLSLFPVVSVILTGNVPERKLVSIARNLRDKIEEISSVLSVDIAGDREETVDIIIDPLMLESYGLTSDIISYVSRNNLLIAAGALDTGEGRYMVKVPGLLEDLDDILTLPIKVNQDAVVTVSDIATVRKGYKDPTGFARVNGKPALVLEVSKRTGENIIETVDKVRAVVNQEQQYWTEGVQVLFAQDESNNIKDMVNDLQNNILLAIFLVMIVIIAVIGIRSASFVALAVPGAFLTGILIVSFFGATLNIVVLFSLILSIGMLVDSAIVVVEYANRRMIEGVSYRHAYAEAAKRMSWPIIASTITTLLVFAPLLFWPGVVGQFMKFMPLTLIATLTGSLLMALIFLPALGAWIGRVDQFDDETEATIKLGEEGNLEDLKGFTGRYVRMLEQVLGHPRKFATSIFILLIGVVTAYIMLGAGVEFFPDIEPENAQVLVHARGNLAVKEKDALIKEVEARITDMRDEIEIFYARSGEVTGQGRDLQEDVIGIIQLEFTDWKYRRSASTILQDIRDRTADLPGIIVEARKQEMGPPVGKPIDIEISSRYPELLTPIAKSIIDKMRTIGGLVDIEDTRPIPAIEWQMNVDREQAARFNVDMAIIGNFIKLITNGLKVTTYRPDESDDEVDVLIRFSAEHRGLQELDRLRAVTNEGAIPLSNFVTRNAEPKLGEIRRVDGRRTISIRAETEEGILPDKKTTEMKAWFDQKASLDPRVVVRFKGEDEEQKEASAFLSNAFILALFAMALVLVFQFNNIWHTVIILSAVFLSTTGVLLGLLITNQPFGIVMCGVGTIALAGIVVNNNIIFIDTYKRLRDSGMDVLEALLRTGAQRMRPILLTAGTTILGLLPMVLAMNIDFIDRQIYFGAPSSQWWQQLSTSIAGGLAFATVLTLFFTPSLILIGEMATFKKMEFPLKTIPLMKITRKNSGKTKASNAP